MKPSLFDAIDLPPGSMASGENLRQPQTPPGASWRAQASCPPLPPRVQKFPQRLGLSGPRCATYWLLGVVHLLHGEVLKRYDSPGLLVLQEGRGKATISKCSLDTQGRE